MKNNLPNFLIVGAPKCGTSSLHQHLIQHPEVFMPSYTREGVKVKEPRFLIRDLVRDRLINGIWTFEEYKSLFSEIKDEKAIGESTVFYLHYYKEAIKNIKHYLGKEVRIIIMLRNPVDRAYSAFQHVSRGPQEHKSFEEALEIEEERYESRKKITPMVLYKKMGMYYETVKAYKDSFENVHVVFYEDFKDNIQIEMSKIYDFLRISHNHSIDLSKKHNVGGKRWKNKILKHFFIDNHATRSFVKLIIGQNSREKLFRYMKDFAVKKVSPMKLETRFMLNEFFKADLEKLGELLNKDLKHWSHPTPNLFIVGAAKSGTSSLHNYLKQHPDIFMSNPKEPHYLINNEIGDQRIPIGFSSKEAYLKLFLEGKNKKYRGESSVMYLMFPDIVIPKIKQQYGEECKIIIMLRNPVERAYSGFQHVRRYNKKENILDFKVAWDISEQRYFTDVEMTPATRHRELGLYHKQVKLFLEAFENVHVIIYDDYKMNFQLEMNKLFDFLNIKKIIIDDNKKHMVGGWQWKNEKHKEMISSNSFVKSAGRLIMPKGLRRMILAMIKKCYTVKSAELSNQDREMLRTFYKEDVKQLSCLLKRDLNYWTE